MVWAAFSHDYKTPLHFFNGRVNAATYQQVLAAHVVPLFRQHPNLQAFQQDNARPHTARATTAFLQVGVCMCVCVYVCLCVCVCVCVCVCLSELKIGSV